MLKGFKRNGFAEIRQGPLIKLVVCLFTLWIACEAAAQSTLPPQVQADLLKQQIVDALKQLGVFFKTEPRPLYEPRKTLNDAAVQNGGRTKRQ